MMERCRTKTCSLQQPSYVRLFVCCWWVVGERRGGCHFATGFLPLEAPRGLPPPSSRLLSNALLKGVAFGQVMVATPQSDRLHTLANLAQPPSDPCTAFTAEVGLESW
jgi:hypothetical protein